jgi:hypothetical protein
MQLDKNDVWNIWASWILVYDITATADSIQVQDYTVKGHSPVSGTPLRPGDHVLWRLAYEE